MSRPILYIAITSHGFGHAVRIASVAAQVQKLCPDILLIVATTVPRWLLESYLEGDFIHRLRTFDVGVIQADSLRMDKPATLAKMEQIRSQQQRIMASELNFLHNNRVGLVLGDIPALIAPIVRKAEIPCWMMGNFGWDFIYGDWGDEFAGIAHWIRDCYQQCDRLFRLPMSESMSSFANITDTGLTGETPRHSLAQLKEDFALSGPREKTILLTFGGLGLGKIPYHNLQYFPDWQFITFDRHAPNLPNLRRITDSYYRPVDFMPLCGRVVSKPGYSTFAEAMRLGIPLVSLTREDFAETPLLLKGIEDYAHHQILSPQQFWQSNWEFLHQTPNPPRRSDSLPINGTEFIAQAVVDYFGGC